MADDRSLIDETNDRFWKRTHYKRGQKLDMSDELDRGMAKSWLRLYAEVRSHRDRATVEALHVYTATRTPYIFVGEQVEDGHLDHLTFTDSRKLDATYAAVLAQPGSYRYVAIFDLARNPHGPLHDRFLVKIPEMPEMPKSGTEIVAALREEGRGVAGRSAARVVGVAKLASGQWSVTTLGTIDDGARWLQQLIHQPTVHAYAAYFDKGNSRWPTPINETFGISPPLVSGW